MIKIESINKEVCKQIRDSINDEIAALVKERFGLDASIGNASFSDKEVTFKLLIKAEGISSQKLELAKMAGWPAIGTKFSNAGTEFEVVDYNTKSYKRPIIAANSTGKRFIFNDEDVNKLAKVN